jgi:hypothetical protein
VNRSAIAPSCDRSSRPLRPTIDTREPKAENTCANSAAMYPPPTITTCSGSSSIRITVSEVSYGTPASAIAGGTVGRLPAAMTIRSAVTVSLPVPSVRCTTSWLEPVNRAWPKYVVTLGLRCTR